MITISFLMNLSYAQPQSKNDLALELIDNICGDTWCEGDFNFEFLELELNAKEAKAKVSFKLISEWSEEPKFFETDCMVKNINSMDDVIGSYRGRPELNDYFYEELSLCISDKEEIFRNILENK
tara:strand:+ start:12859 stop:13230 length:372 start_codon:yes stop_codon:yes gene_type:complete